MATTLTQRPAQLVPRPGGVAIGPGVALSAIAVGGVLSVGLWFHNTLLVQGWGEWLTNAGRLTGIGAGYAIAVVLALMARIPALERGLGSDRLARWHAAGGRYLISLAVAHTLLIIWGYAVLAHTGVVHQTSTLLTGYPDVLMATVGLGLLVAVGVVSARAARRRLRYETWHFIHLYTYLAIALAFAHQFATGADFAGNAGARWLWSAMYIAVAGLLLWYRFCVPLIAAARHQLRVVEVRREGMDVVSVYLTGRDLPALRAQPGQFFRWRFLTRGLWWAANPYSLSAPPRPDWLRITVKISGDHSAALLGLRPGTRVLAEGPYGAFTAARRTQRKVLLLAGGVGITPLRALFETLPGRPGDITLIYRANTDVDVIFRSELDWIAHQRGARVHYLLGPPHPGSRDPLAPRRLARLVPDLAGHDVYLCGPPAMMAVAEASLRTAGVPRRRIHTESFAF